jgi:hypothetical protein
MIKLPKFRSISASSSSRYSKKRLPWTCGHQAPPVYMVSHPRRLIHSWTPLSQQHSTAQAIISQCSHNGVTEETTDRLNSLCWLQCVFLTHPVAKRVVSYWHAWELWRTIGCIVRAAIRTANATQYTINPNHNGYYTYHLLWHNEIPRLVHTYFARFPQ